MGGRGNKAVVNTNSYHGKNKASYILARLERDKKTDLLERVNAGELSAHAAAIEAGWRKRMIQLEPTVEGFAAAIMRRLDEGQRSTLAARIASQ